MFHCTVSLFCATISWWIKDFCSYIKLTSGPRRLQQLPIGILREVAVDHLCRVGQEVEVVVDALHVGGVVVPSCPVTVDEEPASVDVHRVPAVVHRLARDAVAWPVARSLRPASNWDAVQSSVSEQHTMLFKQEGLSSYKGTTWCSISIDKIFLS